MGDNKHYMKIKDCVVIIMSTEELINLRGEITNVLQDNKDEEDTIERPTS